MGEVTQYLVFETVNIWRAIQSIKWIIPFYVWDRPLHSPGNHWSLLCIHLFIHNDQIVTCWWCAAPTACVRILMCGSPGTSRSAAWADTSQSIILEMGESATGSKLSDSLQTTCVLGCACVRCRASGAHRIGVMCGPEAANALKIASKHILLRYIFWSLY